MVIEETNMNKLNFEYPLDSKYLMRKKKSIKRELLKKDFIIKKRIAILGGSTTSDIKDMLDIFLMNNSIKSEFYESEYNKFYEDALFSIELENFNPEIVYIHTTNKNLMTTPNINKNKDEINEELENEYSKFLAIWGNLKRKFKCVIIQNNFEYSNIRLLGNYDRTSKKGLTNYIDRLNLKMSEYALSEDGFYINDINYLSAEIGLKTWHDSFLWYNYKYALSFEAIPYLAQNISNIIKSIYGKNKKALVLDLDNTLWGGIIGDDGIEGIKVGSETAVGEAYLGFQNYIKGLKARGIVLAIASKNEDDIAREGLNHSSMILKEEDFFTIKANWEPKFSNIETIAKEINIGLDSLVFIDDNPAERDIVKQQISNVEVPNVGNDILNYINHIDKNGYFEVTNLSLEDTKRNDYYKENKSREKAKENFNTYEDFLISLDMKADINEAKDIYFERISQLTNKTNQFNLTTKRYSLTEIQSISKKEDKIIIYGRLKDKFGDNGLVGTIAGTLKNKELHIDLWLMSCRVLKRDLEKAMLDYLIEKAKLNGIKKIVGYYFRTSKNNMVCKHYENLGFTKKIETNDFSEWELCLKEKSNKLNKTINLGEY